MRKLVTATALSASLLFAPVGASAATFNDVPSSLTAYEAIDHLSNKGVMSGYGGGQFQPNTYVQRQHIAATINRAIPVTYVRNARHFKDVPPKHRNYSDIMVLQRAGVLNGMANGYFKPADYVTRGQMAIILTKAFNLKNGGKRHAFKDVSPAHGADGAISSLYYSNVVRPDKNGNFKPNERVTRAEYADMLYRAWQASDYPMTPRHEAKKVVENALFDKAAIHRELRAVQGRVDRKRQQFIKKNYPNKQVSFPQATELMEMENRGVKAVYNQMAKTILDKLPKSDRAHFQHQLDEYERRQENFMSSEMKKSGGTAGTFRYVLDKWNGENRQQINSWLKTYGY